jgi:hypothetical protein
MVGYYRRLKEGKGRGEALRQVQLEMLKEVKRRHPYYWASFIQSGEWANLNGNDRERGIYHCYVLCTPHTPLARISSQRAICYMPV